MSLFPAYAPPGSAPVPAPAPGQYTDEHHVCEPDKEINNSCDPNEVYSSLAAEAILLKTSSESSGEDVHSSKKRRHDSSPEERTVKKKKRKHKRKDKKSKSKDNHIKTTDEFYMDNKLDRGNLYVSTLYYPGRPTYRYSKHSIGYLFTEYKKMRKQQKRYFEVDIRFLNDRSTGDDPNNGESEKNMGDFEKITDSKQKWDDSRTEKELTEKTTRFNTYLSENPNDVDMWLQFVKFQEDRYMFDVLNYRTISESSARDACRQKQLAVLEKALALNPKNTNLLDAKLNLARLAMPSQDYLAMVKELIAAESEGPIAVRLWCALTDGVCGSAALCSAVTARDTYAAAATTLRRDQRAYLELFYRHGLFLRQAGLLEQLHLLMDLVTAMNFTTRSEAFKVDELERAERELKLTIEEEKLTSSGLPLSAVWVRLETLRAAAHWRTEPPPAAERDADPQRWPDAADVADMLAPLTRQAHMFTLAVHVLRLARVPLLPHDACSGALLRALHPLTDGRLAWEIDGVEALIPILLEMARPDALRLLLSRHLVRPHYFDNSDGYRTFVEDLFAACVGWMTGRERLALLIWWFRFQSALLSFDRENRTEAIRVRKLLQRQLMQHGDSPYAFAEFARVEIAACGRERARHVAVAAMRSADAACRADRLAIARCICEVSDGSEAGKAAGSWALACAALGQSLPTDISVGPSTNLLEQALSECERRCSELFTEACDDFQTLEPVDCMLPSDDTEWWACRYEILSRLRPNISLLTEHRQLEKMGPTAKTPRTIRMHEAASAAIVAVAGREAPTLARISLVRHPQCVRLAVLAGTRPVTFARPPPAAQTPIAALAAILPVLQACEEDNTSGNGRRALAALRRACGVDAAGARSPLVWKMRLEAEARLDGGHSRSALYLALDACPTAKCLYIEGVRAAPSEFAELTDLLLEKQLRLHALPEELTPI